MTIFKTDLRSSGSHVDGLINLPYKEYSKNSSEPLAYMLITLQQQIQFSLMYPDTVFFISCTTESLI